MPEIREIELHHVERRDRARGLNRRRRCLTPVGPGGQVSGMSASSNRPEALSNRKRAAALYTSHHITRFTTLR